MITSLAPLGATHNIVLVLAYGEILPLRTGEPNPLGSDHTREVTVTAHLKPKDGVKGEPRDLQFKGPACDVETELKEKLPLVTQKLVAHLASLEALDAELKAEQEKAQKEHEQKKTSAANTVKTGVRSTTTYPAKSAAKKPEPAKPATPAAKPAAKSSGKAKPTVAAATSSAAAALQKLRESTTTAAETPAASPAEDTDFRVVESDAAPAPAAEPNLAALAAAFKATPAPTSDDEVAL